MKNSAVSSGGRGGNASMSKSEGYKMYHLMIVAIFGLLLGAYYQYLKNTPSAVVPPPTPSDINVETPGQ